MSHINTKNERKCHTFQAGYLKNAMQYQYIFACKC